MTLIILHLGQVAFGRRLGIEEPQLMKLMRATLHSHSEWFKLQMCKDRFESLLKIDSLKEVNPPLLSTSSGLLKSNSDSCTHGSSQVTKSSGARTSEDGSSPIQASSRDACDENAILKVMVSNFNLKKNFYNLLNGSGFFPCALLQVIILSVANTVSYSPDDVWLSPYL